MAISFFSEDTNFVLSKKNSRKKWLREVAQKHNKQIGELNYVFCSDEYLWQINVDYLDHDTYTDIITFDNSEEEEISGDIFISVDRVKENAENFDASFNRELTRVLSHGLLHLIGFKDKSNEDAKLMRKQEDLAIQLYE